MFRSLTVSLSNRHYGEVLSTVSVTADLRNQSVRLSISSRIENFEVTSEECKPVRELPKVIETLLGQAVTCWKDLVCSAADYHFSDNDG